MTVIAGYMGEKKYHIASDNEMSLGRAPVAMNESEHKVFEFPDFMIGSTGRGKAMSSMRYWNPPKRKKSETLDHYIRVTMLESLEKNLTKGKVMGVKDTIPDYDVHDSYYLVVCKEGIYLIAYDFTVVKIKSPFYAIGCGGDVAIGALGAARKFGADNAYDEETILRSAVQLAAEFCNGVNDDARIISKEY